MAIKKFNYKSKKNKSKILINVKLETPWKISLSNKVHKKHFSIEGSSKHIPIDIISEFDEHGYAEFKTTPSLNEYYLKQFALDYFGLSRFWHDDRAQLG